MISRRRWKQVEPILDRALNLPPEEVPSFLDAACHGDRELRRQVDRLLIAARAEARLLEEGAAALAAPLLEPAREQEAIGPYRLVRRVGEGGMGVVYLARDPRLDRNVALKLLPSWLALDESSKARFMEEARAASALDHPNIETVHEIGQTEDGRLYIVMAYYEGETLAERITRGPLPLEEAVGIASQLAGALAAAHARGIVHRDVKPSNVILTPEGGVRLVDFGVAKLTGQTLTKPGATPGTVAYMSPEQTRGEEVDGRADLWSLGIVLYEMLSGQRPFRALEDRALIQQIRHDDPEPLARLGPYLPSTVATVVGRCLAKQPAERYPDDGALLDDLQSVAARGSATAARRHAGRPGSSLRRAAAVAAAGTIVVGGAVAIALTRPPPRRGAVVAAASTIVVIPPLPIAEDTGLARLGRELAVTLSTNLDGVGGIRTVPATTVFAQTGGPAFTPEQGAEMAQRLGAGAVLHGSLLRAGAGVRLELVLLGVRTREPIARAGVAGPAHDIVALTDSATLAILRPLWRRGEVPTPNLAALTTSSVPALRAYLEGEQALARGDFRQAVAAFERAFEADSTFWFAYWRSLYPRIYDGSWPDSVTLARLFAHRDEFPVPDRLLVEGYLAETRTEQLGTLRDVTRRYPNYWPGWWQYGNQLVHWFPDVGTTYADARSALERVVALNPSFASGWEHLFWIAVLQRDTTAARRSLERVERFASPDAFRFDPEYMPYLRTLHEILSSGGDLTPELAARTAEVASGLVTFPPEAIATGFLAYGFPRAQGQLADAILRRRPAPEMAAAQWMAKAMAWATRGAWDSSLVALGRWVRLSDDPWTPLRAYGLAVTGASLGMVDAETAGAWRGTAARSAAAETPEGRAELAWLDGLGAWSRLDAKGIASARGRVRESGARWAEFLDRSLEAFGRDATGDHSGAAQSLAALEWESAEKGRHAGYGDRHPHVSAVHRLSASRWLLAVGDTSQAARLLSWHEAVLVTALHRPDAVIRIVEPLALLERARIEEARGSHDLARQHYAGFLERYDTARGESVALVEEALGALTRLRPPDGFN